MSKMSIADAAIKLGVSKEAIHNRIRRGSLESIIEDGLKYVIIKPTTQLNKQTTRNIKTSVVQDNTKYYKLLEEQNEKLQLKVEKLEDETKTLRDQKEAMLIEERIKIEQVYKDKDEQLKNILSTISSNFLLNLPNNDKVIAHESDLEAEIETEENKQDKLVLLKKYLKERNFSTKKCKKIKDRFKKVSKKDSRIYKVNKKLYINPDKFDYSDLL